MADPKALEKCLQAFLSRDYRKCVKTASALLEAGITRHEVRQLLLLSLQRLGKSERAQELGAGFLRETTDPWQQTLLQLTLGKVDPANVLAKAKTKVQRCQAGFYIAGNLLTVAETGCLGGVIDPQILRQMTRSGLAESVQLKADCVENWLAEALMAGGQLPSTPLPTTRAEVDGGRVAPEHTDAAQRVCEMIQEAVQFFQQGQHEEAIRLATQTCKEATANLGDRHELLGSALGNLAQMHELTGNYGAALPLYEQALEIKRAVLGESHHTFASTLSNLAVLHTRLGNYQEAIPLHLQALALREKILGRNHEETAMSLNNLAGLYEAVGNFKAAIPLCQRALKIHRRTRGERDPHYAGALGNLATFHRHRKDYSTAEPLALQALQLWRSLLGEDHEDVASAAYNLGLLYREKGDYPGAERLFSQAREVYRKVLGTSHPALIQLAFSLGCLYSATGRSAEALSLLQEGIAVEDRKICQALSVTTERQRLALVRQMGRTQAQFLSLIRQDFSNSSPAVGSALDLVLRRKALVAETMAVQCDAILGGKYPGLQASLRQLSMLRMQIANKTLASPSHEDLPAHQRQLADWNTQRELLEAELARQIPEMNLEQKLRAADRRAVALALPEGVALVEFVRFHVREFKAIPARGGGGMAAASIPGVSLARPRPRQRPNDRPG